MNSSSNDSTAQPDPDRSVLRGWLRRLAVRLVLSHLLVAALGAASTYLVVRQLAPALFDESLRRGPMGYQGGRNPTNPSTPANPANPIDPGRGHGPGQGWGWALRDSFADAVDTALWVGALVGLIAAAAVGVFAAVRLLRPLERVRTATRRLADGRYDQPIPVPVERELADLVRDVNVLGEALQTTEARRVRLLGEVAHEMRTPLTVIDGYVEGMIDGLVPTGRVELGHVSDEVRRLRRLAEDLSTLSRSEEGRWQMNPVLTNLRDVVSAAAERLRPQLEDSDLSLVVVVGEQQISCRVDPDRIAQVVTNLVGNAIRATPPGGRIQVEVGQGAQEAWFAVSDTGVGLAPQELDRVFERFYRASTKTPPSGERGSGQHGLGIGLTIARGIVRLHGGDLSATSEGIGHGATFRVRLPLAPQGCAAGR